MTRKSLKIGDIKRQTLNQKVYEALKASILNGDIKPESKLNEVQVAEQLNVSATPVREAFRMLASEGLVEIQPWKGVIVKKYFEDEVFEAYQCREALEVLAVSLAVEKIEENDLFLLESFIESSKNNTNVTQLVQINTKIHDLIIEKSGNRKLISLLKSLNDILLHDRNISAFDSQRRNEIYHEHIELLQALKRKDRKMAEEAMRKHIINGYAYIEKKSKKNNFTEDE